MPTESLPSVTVPLIVRGVTSSIGPKNKQANKITLKKNCLTGENDDIWG